MPVMRYLMALMPVVLIAGGCARRPPEPPELPVIAEAPPPVEPAEEAVEAVQEPAARAPEAPAESAEEPRPQPAAERPAQPPAEPAAPDKPRGEKLPWSIPEGPLDDAKFIVISAKYIVAAVKASEKGEDDPNAMMEVLRAILKEARVTMDDYTSHAMQVQEDPERARKAGDAIIRLAEERGGIKLTDEAAAALGGLKPRAIVEAE